MWVTALWEQLFPKIFLTSAASLRLSKLLWRQFCGSNEVACSRPCGPAVIRRPSGSGMPIVLQRIRLIKGPAMGRRLQIGNLLIVVASGVPLVA